MLFNNILTGFFVVFLRLRHLKIHSFVALHPEFFLKEVLLTGGCVGSNCPYSPDDGIQTRIQILQDFLLKFINLARLFTQDFLF